MRPIDYFDMAAELNERETALIDQDVRVSFGELRRQSEQIASALSELAPAGKPFGVALYSPNDYRVMATMVGTMRAGAVLAPIHARNTIDVNIDVLTRIKPKCLIYHSSVVGDVRAMKAQLPSVEAWICLDAAMNEDRSLEDFAASGRAPAADWGDVDGNPDWPVQFWQTSGTTDRPKIVIETCGTLDAMLRIMRQRRLERAYTRPIVLAVAPLSHAGGSHAFARLTLGSTVVIMRSFDAQEILQQIERHRVTDMWLPPTALALLLNYPDVKAFDLSSLAHVDLGAAAVAPATLRDAVDILGPCISQTYGQIETGVVTILDAPIVAASVAGDHPERLLTSGRSLFNCRGAIMSEDGRLLPPGETGEIVVRGRTVKRYLDPAQTAEARRYGWHHTGDLGFVDESGCLSVVGRKRDVIITGGFKVLAAEIEQVLMELPAVHECAVVAAPDLVRGEAIKAIVVFKTGQSLTDQGILAHCRKRLPRGKIPTSIEPWPMLPKSAVGKVDKRCIRQRIWAEAPSATL